MQHAMVPLGKKLLLFLFFLYSKAYHSKYGVNILVFILADSKAVTDYNILFLDSVACHKNDPLLVERLRIVKIVKSHVINVHCLVCLIAGPTILFFQENAGSILYIVPRSSFGLA